ncbi:toll/interleukin-1 receptor domain-containing protein [Vibrio scophthalmi]|uniref:toll/interleukin-1 receptor domain-containing protein n=1 Tax=Vibrio scophthalmi TaxID=45658 RepID=UPI003872F8FA
MSEVNWDVFISHASEDKESVVLPLVDLLLCNGMKVWLDKGEIFLGDSIREKIDEGLANSQFGVVVISHNFFAKNWTRAELDSLFTREMRGQKVILPVWHNISAEEVSEFSPLIAGKLAVSTSDGLGYVAEQISRAIFQSGRKESVGKPIHTGKLTKKAIMSFPVGCYLVSNCYSSFDMQPLLDVKLGAIDDRESVWELAKTRGADSRLCNVFIKYEDYQAHMRKLDTLIKLKE